MINNLLYEFITLARKEEITEGAILFNGVSFDVENVTQSNLYFVECYSKDYILISYSEDNVRHYLNDFGYAVNSVEFIDFSIDKYLQILFNEKVKYRGRLLDVVNLTEIKNDRKNNYVYVDLIDDVGV